MVHIEAALHEGKRAVRFEFVDGSQRVITTELSLQEINNIVERQLILLPKHVHAGFLPKDGFLAQEHVSLTLAGEPREEGRLLVIPVASQMASDQFQEA